MRSRPTMWYTIHFQSFPFFTGLEKVSFHPTAKKGNTKDCPNHCTIVLTSHTSKIMLKILQAKLQHYVNQELPDGQAGFRKSRRTRDQVVIEKAREFHKTIYFFFIVCATVVDCVDHNKLWKILREIRIPDHLTFLLRNLYAGQEVTELDVEQRTGSKLLKEYIKAIYCHPAYLTYMQSTSCEMPGWIKHKLDSRLREGVSITSDMQMT